MQHFFHSRHIYFPPIQNATVYSQQMLEFTLQKSRWFTRGWTLQELLAPCTVELFSKERVKLGNKLSLAKELREITGIPSSALQGEPLSDSTFMNASRGVNIAPQRFRQITHIH